MSPSEWGFASSDQTETRAQNARRGFWVMALYLVTGGAGFIGSHLVDRLQADGHDVRVLDNLSTGKRSNLAPGVELIVGDIRDAETVREAMVGAAGCFHLAAVASVQACTDDWLGGHGANLTGAISVFDAAVRMNARPVPVVYASSAATYGDNENCPLSEDAATRPLTAYGADKLGCELHARAAATVYGLPSAGMRFFNVYGPRQDPKSPYSGVISIFAERLATGRDITIHGDGGQTRDFVYVGDVCEALYGAMVRCKHGSDVFNVCTGREVSVSELAALLSRLLNSHARTHHGAARAGDIRRSLGDNSRLGALLGWVPSTPLEVGLRDTLDWMISAQRGDHAAPVPA